MAITTTAVNACNVVIQLDDIGGTLRDISGSSNSVNLDFSVDLGDYKVFGTAWRGRLECGKDATISLEAVYSTASAEARDILENWFENGGARTIQIDVPNSTIGNRRYSGEVRLSSLSIPLDSEEAGPVMVTAELAPDGVFDISTISS